jgi:hypothetical protein
MLFGFFPVTFKSKQYRNSTLISHVPPVVPNRGFLCPAPGLYMVKKLKYLVKKILKILVCINYLPYLHFNNYIENQNFKTCRTKNSRR